MGQDKLCNSNPIAERTLGAAEGTLGVFCRSLYLVRPSFGSYIGFVWEVVELADNRLQSSTNMTFLAVLALARADLESRFSLHFPNASHHASSLLFTKNTKRVYWRDPFLMKWSIEIINLDLF